MHTSSLRALVVALFLAACTSGGQPHLQMDVASFDLGDVVNGQVVARELRVHNTGGNPLVVQSVTVSCGCVVATLDPMTVPAGGQAVLYIEFDSGAYGPSVVGKLHRRVTLVSNDPAQPEAYVDFTANVLPQPPASGAP